MNDNININTNDTDDTDDTNDTNDTDNNITFIDISCEQYIQFYLDILQKESVPTDSL